MSPFSTKRATLMLVLALVTTLVAAPMPIRAADVDDGGTNYTSAYLPGEVLVYLTDYASLATVTSRYRLVVLDRFGARRIYRLRILDGMTPPAKARQLETDALRVVFAEPNFVDQIPSGKQRISWYRGEQEAQDEMYAAQWAPGTMRLPEAHTRSTGAGVTVAVLDSGIDRTHPLFMHPTTNASRLTRSQRDFVDNDLDPSEQQSAAYPWVYGHGTHVAGLVLTAAPDAWVMPVRVLDETGQGNLWVLAEAFEWAVLNGAHVVNFSLGAFQKTDLMEDLLEDYTCSKLDDGDVEDEAGDDDCEAAGGRGVVVTASGGNGGYVTPQRPEYPGAESAPGVLAVAAHDHYSRAWPYSTRGAWIDVSAPGVRVTSAFPGDHSPNPQYATWSGTSMAAPLAAGQAALVRARERTLSATQIVVRIKTTTDPLVGTTSPGRVDAAESLGLQ